MAPEKLDSAPHNSQPPLPLKHIHTHTHNATPVCCFFLLSDFIASFHLFNKAMHNENTKKNKMSEKVKNSTGDYMPNLKPKRL